MSAKKPSQATIVVQLALETTGLELFHTGNSDPHVMIPQGHASRVLAGEVDRVPALAATSLLRTGRRSRRKPGATGCARRARGNCGGTVVTSTRYISVSAEHDGAPSISILPTSWQAIRIDAAGWEIVAGTAGAVPAGTRDTSPPYRSRTAASSELRRFVNVDRSRSFRPSVRIARRERSDPRPYAILLVHGEQGSAKSTLRQDLSCPRRSERAPRSGARAEERPGPDRRRAGTDWWSRSTTSRHCSQEFSDDLARLAAGAGFSARQLYTDLEEVIVHVARPIAVNGIEEVATEGRCARSKPRARCCRRSAATKTRTRSGIELRRARTILGALLDAVSYALANLESTPVPNIRMADSSPAGERRGAGTRPTEAGSFIDTYRDNRTKEPSRVDAGELVADPGGPSRSPRKGSRERDGIARPARDDRGRGHRKKRGWPTRPHVLSGQLPAARTGSPPDRRRGRVCSCPKDQDDQDQRTRTGSARKRHKRRGASRVTLVTLVTLICLSNAVTTAASSG